MRDTGTNLFGLRIFVNPYLYEMVRKQIKFPRSKKKRIRNKWAKRSCNSVWIRKETCHRMGNQLFMGPELFEQVKKKMTKDGYYSMPAFGPRTEVEQIALGNS